MKGKGKGERGVSKAQVVTAEDKDGCPLQFPDMSPVDHPRLCPRYTAGETMSTFVLRSVLSAYSENFWGSIIDLFFMALNKIYVIVVCVIYKV